MQLVKCEDRSSWMQSLGKSQTIETDMANDIGTKIFSWNMLKKLLLNISNEIDHFFFFEYSVFNTCIVAKVVEKYVFFLQDIFCFILIAFECLIILHYYIEL